MARFVVDAQKAGLRLDQFLARVLPATSVHAARRAIAAGQVRVDGRQPRKGDHLAEGQTVDLAAPATGEGSVSDLVTPDPSVALQVLYQDADLVAVNKPAGIPSHPLRAGETGTAANGLVALFADCATASDDPREGGLGHRLDGDTSGVLLAARNRAAWKALREALRDPACEKSYLAEVAGVPPAQGSFSGAIGRTGRRGQKVAINAGRRPLPAHTAWQTQATTSDASALVVARLHAGRAHQVRAHLAAAGFPILGDPLYGNAVSHAVSAARGATGLRLHALSIRLRHPASGVALLIAAPPPDWASDYSVSR